MFGLDLSFVILVPERKRGIDTGIQENFDSLFDLDIRVKPEYDGKGNRRCFGHENDSGRVKPEVVISPSLLWYYNTNPLYQI